MVASSSATKIVGPDVAQPANTKVKIEIKTFAIDNSLIK